MAYRKEQNYKPLKFSNCNGPRFEIRSELSNIEVKTGDSEE